MVNIREHILEIQTLIFLWSIAILDFLEILTYKFHIFEIEIVSFWNIMAMGFNMIWHVCGTMFCAAGLAGMEDETRIDFLRKSSIPYFWCSAACKGIFTLLLLVLPCGNEYYFTAIYASSEPILLILFGKRNRFALQPNLSSHLIVIVLLVYAAFIVRRYYNSEVKKIQARMQARNQV